jgi:hypothetical protein
MEVLAGKGDGRATEILRMKIAALFEANDSTYGYWRIHAALARGGESLNAC